MLKKNEFKIVSPTAILGYGYPLDSFESGMRENPDLIAVDAGSIDPGPYYLGSGKSFTDKIGVKRDLRYMLKAGVRHKIPVVIGSAGGSGSKPHVQWCREIIEEIACEENLSFKLGVVYADIPREVVLQSLREGKITPLAGLDNLNEKTIQDSKNIVAQMGTEPIERALTAGCTVVLAGRAYDPAVFAALPIMKGFDRGLAIHLGKILECAAIAAEPGSGSDCVLGILKEDSFILKPLSAERKFTRESVAAHSLYEKSDPFLLPGPGGALDLSKVSFEQLDNGKVKVTGSIFKISEKNQIKLEAARLIGYRTVSIAGVRDPIMIQNISKIVQLVRERVDSLLQSEKIQAVVNFHIYGKDGVMGKLETEKEIRSHEIGIVIEVVSDTQENAGTVCSLTRSTLLHYGYEGRVATAGNLAFPFSPSDLKAGRVYEFSMYHLMEIDNEDIFKLETFTIN